ncbi:kinase-like protein [Westerdykella ornata]|uniref:Kinase-like protein n=1 Tax=Westerdykella ornata TaxID=318751 RepID=A0A6A6JGT4_WESOR|nr:kinase-like protein [Westerdykella ornata]KAF2274429.1 kinase-like protein [Westerdykella ornata]
MEHPLILVNSLSPDLESSSPPEERVEIPQPQPEAKRKGRDYDSLNELLRECSFPHEDPAIGEFWPCTLLERILTKARIMEELADYQKEWPEMFAGRTKEDYADQILGLGETGNRYLRMFAGLVLVGKGEQIGRLMEAGVCDNDIPLVRCISNPDKRGKCMLARKSSPNVPLDCFSVPVWGIHDRGSFDKHQRSLDVVHLGLNSDKTVKHEDFDAGVVMPWTTRTRTGQGGYGTVYRVTVPRECHDFDGALQAIEIHDTFAVKEIIRKKSKLDKEDVELWREVEMLKRFSGAFHDHLVTLLMSWSVEGQHCLLFPWAGCDLDKYWKRETNQVEIDPLTKEIRFDDVHWVSAQILGLTGALNLIHNPTHLHLNPEERKYGRHGDIKPENILFYPSPKYPKGILVISDFGLCALNSDLTRSNIPGEAIPQTPGYRPPECDLEGGKISRSYDIWTFGCLLLEMVCWALGGRALRDQFSEDRFAVYISGVQLNIFFDLQKKHEGDKYVIKVKDTVKEYFIKLHAAPSCTQYFHELLDIIEQEMIIVLTPDKERIRSGALLQRIEEMHSRVSNAEKGYCQTPCPQFRELTQDVAFEAELNNTAKGNVQIHKGAGLKVHRGEVRKSMGPDELQAMEYAS